MLHPQTVVSLFSIIPGMRIYCGRVINILLSYFPFNKHGHFFVRASPEFIIPLAKYVKAVYHTRVSVGMRFRMLFETEESSVRR
jgi:hypothetical protein